MYERIPSTAVGTMNAEINALPLRAEGIASAFQERDEEHRIVLSLHFFERLALEQISVVLDAPMADVRLVYAEAVHRLTTRPEPQRQAA